jgi:hypothetical protein
MEVPKTECLKCGAVFADVAHLKRHEQQRKTPCDLRVHPPTEDSKNVCRHCNKSFSSQTSMYRHIRQSCDLARVADRQVATNPTQQTTIAELQKAVVALTARIAQLDGQSVAIQAPGQVNAETVNQTSGQTNNGSNVVNNTFNIIPWDGERCINVSTADIIAAFTTNPKLREYARLPADMISDREKARPYVSEMFMDLIKRTHENPAARNVYLNPRRSDQALVQLKSGSWKVVTLQEASDMLMSGVAKAVHDLAMSDKEIRALPLEAQHALAVAGLLYGDEPEEYVRHIKPQMAAHLANMSPPESRK